MSTLTDLRKEIDELDQNIIELLKKRLATVLSTLEKKDKIEDLKREEEILFIIKNHADDIDTEMYLKTVYQSIFSEGKRIQSKIKKMKDNKK